MGDDVVHLPGNTSPFGDGGQLRLLVAFPLKTIGALPQLR